MRDLLIRSAVPADREEVARLVTAAFGRPDEARLVEALDRDGDVAIALVAERDGVLVGHVLLSPMTAPFRALGLAPLSVAPAAQRMGIGGALVCAAIERARGDGWRAVFLLGDPDYYGRFGFSAAAAMPFGSPYAGPHFQLLVLDDEPLPSGAVAYASAFSGF